MPVPDLNNLSKFLLDFFKFFNFIGIIAVYVLISNFNTVSYTFLNTFNYKASYIKGEFLIFLYTLLVWFSLPMFLPTITITFGNIFYFSHNNFLDITFLFLGVIFNFYLLLTLISLIFRRIYNYSSFNKGLQNNSIKTGCISIIIVTILFILYLFYTYFI